MSKAKRKERQKKELQEIQNNINAKGYGGKKPSYTPKSIRSWRPMTAKQGAMVSEFHDHKNICCAGSAGTGKTFVAIALAMNDVLDDSWPVEKLMIVRSCVATRDPGHLPGTAEEKSAPYEDPYSDIVNDLFEYPQAYAELKHEGYIQFQPTTFIRGKTWDNTIILIDEPQNMTFHELLSVATRVGKNSRIIMCGDTKQVDLNPRKEESGYDDWLKVAETMFSFSIIEFSPDDVVRSGLAKEILQAIENYTIEDPGEPGYINPADMTISALHRQQALRMEISSRADGFGITMPYEAYNELLAISAEIIRRAKETAEDPASVVSLAFSQVKKPDTEN